MINYVIFDMDGTLFDTEPLYKEAWIKTLVDWNLPDPEGLHPLFVGTGEAEIIEILKKAGGEHRDYSSIFSYRDEHYYYKLIEKSIPLKAGCVEILEFLREKGIKIALATSTHAKTAHGNLKKAGVFDYFDKIVTGDMIQHGKPAPDIFLTAGELICADPDETIVCEDSFSGIKGAHAAKMKPVMVIDQLSPTPEIAKLTYGIGNSLFDVIDLIKKENKYI
ncbi:MAG: HAD family phosphatase [Ruminococcaceae bacterium]|nr:HAD family phosphatase [Oscillospiraceae bacterium]